MTTRARYFQTMREARPKIDWRAMLTQAAFCLALALVAARCMQMETVRDPFDVQVNGTPLLLGTGADSSLVLDILCCAPAILVLLRRSLDKTYTIRWSASLILLLPMCGWMMLSARWASDKFEDIVSTANFVAAMALLWAMAQLVRSWARLRIVAAVAYGLLLVLLVRGFYMKFIDMPSMLEQKSRLIQESGLDPHSFGGEQFIRKMTELMGFNASPNSYAGLLVLLLAVAAGLAIQRIRDRDDPAWSIALGLSAPLVFWLLIYTQSKAALVMPILAAAMFAILWKWRGPIARQSKKTFWIGAGIVAFILAAAIGHGLFHHSLPTASLNFRWRYWIGAMRMFRSHPLVGVGWDNFGPNYLRYRLAVASEEIRDPHNFLVRFLVELGLVGFGLMLAWLLRLWWELTRPNSPPMPPQPPRLSATPQWRAVLFVASIALLAVVINSISSIDFAQSGTWIGLELINRMLYLCALLFGSLVVALRSLEVPQLDERPAPWLLYGILIAVGILLIHNLIEFSMFEAGPACLLGALIGAALGVRMANPPVRNPRISWAAVAGLVAMCAGCAAAGNWLAYPVARAEAAAHRGDDDLRAGKFDAASGQYAEAYAAVPWNSDYACRAGRALHLSLGSPLPLSEPAAITHAVELQNRILFWYGQAIEDDPINLTAYQLRAIYWLQMNEPQHMIADYSTVMQLNPNEVSNRLQYAHALEALHMLPEAKRQLILALEYDDLLDKAEPKRLPPQQRANIEQEINSLPSQ